MLAADATPPLFFVADGLVLLPVLLEVLSLEDKDVEDDVDFEFDDDFDEVACRVALAMVEFVVEFVPDMVMFAMLPVPIVEFKLDPVVVELPEEPVELLLDLDPGATTGVTLLELDEAVGKAEDALVEPVDEARAARASVGQVEQPPKSWSMPE